MADTHSGSEENNSRSGRMRNAVTLITGGSRGIGLAIAQAYAEEGAIVCIAATNTARLAQAKELLELSPERIMVLPLDVTDREACFAVVHEIEKRFGRLDVLVNNAGIYKGRSFLDYGNEDFQRLLDVNLFGVINCMQAALPGMIARGYGRIVNIASTAGKWGSLNQSAYNISKHAVVALTRCVALETAKTGVTVNAICPGFVQTDMVDNLKNEVAKSAGISPEDLMKNALTRVPMGRVLAPQEISGMAVLLGSPAGSGMTGQSVQVDGGMLMC